jgi:hypothetical protein
MPVATTAKMTLFVTSTRANSRVRIGSTGKYVSTPVNDIEIDLPKQPLLTTASSKAFWLAVLAIATANVSALP